MSTVTVNGATLSGRAAGMLERIHAGELGDTCQDTIRRASRMIIAYAQQNSNRYTSREVLDMLGWLNDIDDIFSDLMAAGNNDTESPC